MSLEGPDDRLTPLWDQTFDNWSRSEPGREDTPTRPSSGPRGPT